ncbi:extracellular solute-binding protein family 3 [Ancylobacter novellus DSM 506]|uniref:Extracellular solute-binding protein family 3 n=1 Tax=Ancylobacter novellus (strain ATCC 8093 / DSM 506 / JCM 20403 / CCM 1077 / IAM 12100 / NBRC 12443 / NCIMB 10456) TaxID=639283 RepID=D7A546_ANCN5|nr:extracellular solute-binding protein family 3 [Ancylobacter novellus DSM 506]
MRYHRRSLGAKYRPLTAKTGVRFPVGAKDGTCDIAFRAAYPSRAADFLFSPPYLLIEGAYLVEARMTLSGPAEVDAAGRKIAATKGTAYAQYLARNLKQAEFVLSDDAFASFRAGGIDAVAGIRQPLVSYAAANPDIRVLAERFMEISQVVALTRGKLRAAGFVGVTIEELKASGFVRGALDRSGHADVLVAPAAAGS